MALSTQDITLLRDMVQEAVHIELAASEERLRTMLENAVRTAEGHLVSEIMASETRSKEYMEDNALETVKRVLAQAEQEA